MTDTIIFQYTIAFGDYLLTNIGQSFLQPLKYSGIIVTKWITFDMDVGEGDRNIKNEIKVCVISTILLTDNSPQGTNTLKTFF